MKINIIEDNPQVPIIHQAQAYQKNFSTLKKNFGVENKFDKEWCPVNDIANKIIITEQRTVI